MKKAICTKCALFGDYRGKKVKPVDAVYKELQRISKSSIEMQKKARKIILESKQDKIAKIAGVSLRKVAEEESERIQIFFCNLINRIETLRDKYLEKVEESITRIQKASLFKFNSDFLTRFSDELSSLSNILNYEIQEKKFTLPDLVKYDHYKNYRDELESKYEKVAKYHAKAKRELENNLNSLKVELPDISEFLLASKTLIKIKRRQILDDEDIQIEENDINNLDTPVPESNATDYESNISSISKQEFEEDIVSDDFNQFLKLNSSPKEKKSLNHNPSYPDFKKKPLKEKIEGERNHESPFSVNCSQTPKPKATPPFESGKENDMTYDYCSHNIEKGVSSIKCRPIEYGQHSKRTPKSSSSNKQNFKILEIIKQSDECVDLTSSGLDNSSLAGILELLSKKKNLRKLKLSLNSLDDDCLGALLCSMEGKSLQALHLNSNKFTIRSLEIINDLLSVGAINVANISMISNPLSSDRHAAEKLAKKINDKHGTKILV